LQEAFSLFDDINSSSNVIERVDELMVFIQSISGELDSSNADTALDIIGKSLKLLQSCSGDSCSPAYQAAHRTIASILSQDRNDQPYTFEPSTFETALNLISIVTNKTALTEDDII
jgi:hypothetical protein